MAITEGTFTTTLAPLPRLPNAVRDDADVPGTYVRDGARLLRLLGSGDLLGWCAVEDCATLELTLVPGQELLGWELEPIGHRSDGMPSSQSAT